MAGMRDYTAAVIRLEEAYSSMQIARKRAADEVKAEFQRRIRDEIARRQYEIEHEFARALKLEAERGLPGNVIRTEVLRTQDWGRWKKWRDMADIEPERVALANAKAEREAEAQREAGYRWEPFDNEFGFALVLTKAEDGAAFSDDVPGVENGEVVITDIRVRGDRLEAWPDHPGHLEVWERYWEKGGRAMKQYATALANKHRKEAE